VDAEYGWAGRRWMWTTAGEGVIIVILKVGDDNAGVKGFNRKVEGISGGGGYVRVSRACSWGVIDAVERKHEG
jgi:hypothetical protein